MATSESAVYDPGSGLVTFSLVFNQAPDFYTTDRFDRAANDFQYYIGYPFLGIPNAFTTIIRGSEIYLGAGIPIRAEGPPSPDPTSGGWGPVLDTVPFTLVGAQLTFSAPLSVIDKNSTDGHFAYVFQTDVFGGATFFLQNQQSTVTPEPAATPVLFLITGWLVLKIKYGSRQPTPAR